MAAQALSPLGTSVVGVVQWTLVGIEALVLAYVLAWVLRRTRLRRLAPRFRWRQAAQGEVQLEVARPRAGRLVSVAGGAPAPMRPESPARGVRAVRTVRGGRVPAREAPRALHCPACGALLARGEAATRLVTRCTGCDRRVAVRMDDDRVVVTVEG